MTEEWGISPHHSSAGETEAYLYCIVHDSHSSIVEMSHLLAQTAFVKSFNGNFALFIIFFRFDKQKRPKLKGVLANFAPPLCDKFKF